MRAKMMERAFKVQEEEVQDGLGQINALRSDREIAEREVETLRARLAALEASRPIPPGSPADAPDADAIAEKLQVAEAALAAKQAELEQNQGGCVRGSSAGGAAHGRGGGSLPHRPRG